MPETRPNPDVLLSRIATEERQSKRGRFRLFFGMAAGVGKTFAMLQAAQDRRKDGIDVQIGVLETHGRSETQKISLGLPVIPKKQINYRGTVQEEMDLDAILAKRPALVLIDELAHTNVTGSRHEKRYQDVLEILDAGIDVYSTMNVQHLESRSDVVGLITAVTVRETVPDSVLDLADQIELVDITPHELLDRLKEGKIYPGRKTEQALQYFFQESNLSALREIALRVTADKVERDLRGLSPSLRSPQSSANSEKILVAVSHSPLSEKLIRSARRIVEDLEIPWVAVHVDTGRVLTVDEQNQLVKNLNLAEEMGAECVTLHGAGIAAAISDYAKNNKVVQMILGRSFEKERFWLRPSRFIEELIRKNPNIDISVLQQARDEKTATKKRFSLAVDWRVRPFVQALIWVLLITGGNFILADSVGHRVLGFVFLLMIVILSAFLPFAAVLGAAFLSALIWDYCFIPPRFTFTIHSLEDMLMLLAYFIVAGVSGFLTFQIRKNQKILKEREERTQALYEILKSMTLVKGTKPLIDLALVKVESLFDAECAVLLGEADKISQTPEFGVLPLSENDRAVASWSYLHGRKAGWSTDTLPLAKVLSLCLKSGFEKLGVLVLKPKVDKKLTPEQESLLFSIANQIGIVLAKQRHDDEIRQTKLFLASEKLQQTLLHSVSHELRTPLTSILGAATSLEEKLKSGRESATTPASLELTHEIIAASERLNQIFENLLDLSRLESGLVKLKQEWFDLAELLHFLIDKNKKHLESHAVQMPPSLPPCYFQGDFELLGHAVGNVLINAAHHSPPQSPISIALAVTGDAITLEIADEGPGIPDEGMPQLFTKFYRVPGTTAGGLGLGLSIAKNLIELHGGRIAVRNKPDGGAVFSIHLPYRNPPPTFGETQT